MPGGASWIQKTPIREADQSIQNDRLIQAVSMLMSRIRCTQAPCHPSSIATRISWGVRPSYACRNCEVCGIIVSASVCRHKKISCSFPRRFDDLTGCGPISCRPWPHLPFGTPPCRAWQVGEGVSPTLDVVEILRNSYCTFKWYFIIPAGSRLVQQGLFRVTRNF